MSVIGIDFGNDSVYLAVARAGGIETLANDYSLRATPACVTFTEVQRVAGVGAKNMVISHNKNAVTNFKKLLGRKFRDRLVQHELQHHVLTSKAVETPDGGIGLLVRYANQDQTFTPSQITAMLFTKLRDITEMAIGIRVADCVISVPSYFTDSERHAVMDSASIAGLNVLRLLNDTAAVALAYGITKQDLPAQEEAPRHVFFVDVGQSSTQISAVAFHKGKLKVLSTVADPSLGGRDFDLVIGQYFAEEFRKTYRLEVASNRRAWLRLLAEGEKLKKQMSANTSELPLNIECFMEDRDVRSKMKRGHFEQLSESLFSRLDQLMRQCLEDSALQPAAIHSVEVVGGSTRIPAIKEMIQKLFGHTASTTLNQDEAVSRGCALMCAMLSPAFKVRDFNVSDVQLYPVHLRWGSSSNRKDSGDMEIFTRLHAVPFVKILTFARSEPFVLEAYYSGRELPIDEPNIGQFKVRDIPQLTSGETPRIKVKVKVNSHGIFQVSSATVSEKLEVPVTEEAMETTAPASDAVPNGDTQKKTTSRTIDLSIESHVNRLSQETFNKFHETEAKMVAADKQETERMAARNAVEEYMYEMRGKCGEELSPFIAEGDKEKFLGKLRETEDWLYEEGEDCMKSVYTQRLADLRKMGDPVCYRYQEFGSRAPVLEDFGHALQLAAKFLDKWRSGDEALAHINQEEAEKLDASLREKGTWLDEKQGLLSVLQRHKDPPISTAQISAELHAFRVVFDPILRKPKPKVEPPPPAPAPQDAPMEGEGGVEANGADTIPNASPKSPQGQSREGGMEVDG